MNYSLISASQATFVNKLLKNNFTINKILPFGASSTQFYTKCFWWSKCVLELVHVVFTSFITFSCGIHSAVCRSWAGFCCHPRRMQLAGVASDWNPSDLIRKEYLEKWFP